MKASLENKYIYRTGDLIKALNVTRFTLINWEKKGYFTPPRVGVRGDRRFTEKQLKEITEAFGPGGHRNWHFNSMTASLT